MVSEGAALRMALNINATYCTFELPAASRTISYCVCLLPYNINSRQQVKTTHNTMHPLGNKSIFHFTVFSHLDSKKNASARGSWHA